jgi:hypothetical protein
MSLPLNMFPYVICNAFVNNEDTSNFFIIFSIHGTLEIINPL